MEIEIQVVTTETRTRVTPGCCKHCGEAYEACKYPVSHAHPTIDAIKLPGPANNIALRYKNCETTAAFTSSEREIWDRSAVMGHSHFLINGERITWTRLNRSFSAPHSNPRTRLSR